MLPLSGWIVMLPVVAFSIIEELPREDGVVHIDKVCAVPEPLVPLPHPMTQLTRMALFVESKTDTETWFASAGVCVPPGARELLIRSALLVASKTLTKT